MFTEIPLVTAALIHAKDERTDVMKLRDAFHIYAKRALKLAINTNKSLNMSPVSKQKAFACGMTKQ
jgi:hypothetical protein